MPNINQHNCKLGQIYNSCEYRQIRLFVRKCKLIHQPIVVSRTVWGLHEYFICYYLPTYLLGVQTVNIGRDITGKKIIENIRILSWIDHKSPELHQ